MAVPHLPPGSAKEGALQRSSYRKLARTAPDPVTESDAIVELMQRSHALRRRLLIISVAASMAGGVVGLLFYMLSGLQIYGRVAGFFYAAGAIVTFVVARRLSNVVARVREARWSAELAERYELDERPLLEAAALFD